MDKKFQESAARVSRILGSMWTFIAALVVILITGIIFRFSQDWQEIVGFTITIATFFILFFLQKSQNVGDKATHAKLDELIRAVSGARNEFTSVEDKHEQEIDRLKQTVAEKCESDGDPEIDEDCEEAVENLSQAQESARSQNR